MFRFPRIAAFFDDELICDMLDELDEVAEALADGSYWTVEDDGDAMDCGGSDPAEWG